MPLIWYTWVHTQQMIHSIKDFSRRWWWGKFDFFSLSSAMKFDNAHVFRRMNGKAENQEFQSITGSFPSKCVVCGETTAGKITYQTAQQIVFPFSLLFGSSFVLARNFSSTNSPSFSTVGFFHFSFFRCDVSRLTSRMRCVTQMN